MKFFKTILLFVLLNSLAIKTYRNVSTPYRFNKALSQKIKSNYNIVFLGDSHFAFGIKNRVLSQIDSNIISYSLPGNSYYNTLLYLETMKKHNSLPDTIIIDSEVHSIQERRSGANSLIGTFPFFYHRNAYFLIGIRHLTIVALESYFPFITSNAPTSIQYFINKKLNNKNNLSYKLDTELLDFYQGRQEYNPLDTVTSKKREEILYRETSEKMVRVLSRVIGICDANGVKLIGLRMPISPYLRAQKKADSVNSYLPKELRIDEINLEDFYKDQTDSFIDIDHLSFQASLGFTKDLVEVLRGRSNTLY